MLALEGKFASADLQINVSPPFYLTFRPPANFRPYKVQQKPHKVTPGMEGDYRNGLLIHFIGLIFS